MAQKVPNHIVSRIRHHQARGGKWENVVVGSVA